MKLLDSMLFYIAVFFNIFKNTLHNFGLLGRRGTSEVVERDIEPAVNIAMDRMIVVAEFARRFPFFEGFGFGCRTVFVGAADIQTRVSAEPAKTRKDIGGQNLD